MIGIVIATVAGCSMLLSAAETSIPIDGAIPWSEESPLYAVVKLFCLNYAFPTIHAGDVKGLVLGIGTGLAVLALALAIAIRPPSGSDDLAGDTLIRAGGASDGDATDSAQKLQIPPLFAAQALFLAFLIWSFVSAGWSRAPELAVGASLLLAIQFIWAVTIAYGLGPNAGRVVTRGVMIVAVATAVLALWYYYGRNPVLRAKFPSGNPNFLAASLAPGLLLLVTYVAEKSFELGSAARNNALLRAVAAIVGIGLVAWAIWLTSSRGVQLGVGFGLVAIIFFSARGKAKFGAIALAVGLAIAASVFYSKQADAESPTGRSATQRLRGYAWSYAWKMFDERPLIGYGQAGFTLSGDANAIGDVQADPKALETRLANAHNEWFQVLSELGSVGFVLILAAVVLTFLAGSAALAAEPPPAHRCALLGSMGSLVALCISECFGVGLRVADVPPFFYTTLGLVWAFSWHQLPSPVRWLSADKGRRVLTGVLGAVVAIVVFLLAQEDFNTARYAYRVADEIEAGRYDEAIRHAERATNSLNPERALANRRQLARAHMRAASQYQASAVDRETRARELEIPDANLLALAAEDRKRCDDHAKAGLQAVQELILRSPNFFNSGQVLYDLSMVLAHQAVVRGDDAQRDQFLRDAAAALKNELLRQPFDVTLAVEYVRTAAGTLELPVVVELLARPLRYAPLPPNYTPILQSLASDAEFETNFGPLREKAMQRCTNPAMSDPVPDAMEVWAPEVSRLASALRAVVGDFEHCVQYLTVASECYRSSVSDAPVATAASFAELSTALFFQAPTQTEKAIGAASIALQYAPPSLEGRRLATSVKQRLVEMQLAAGNENEAGKILRELASNKASDEAISREIGSRYARLAYRLLQRPAAGVLPKPATDVKDELAKWVERARVLNPDDYLGHYVAADLAFTNGDDQPTADSLRVALEKGLDPAIAAQFLTIALQQRPESEPLRKLGDEMRSKARPPIPEGVPPAPDAEERTSGDRTP